MPATDLFQELQWRGLVYQTTDPGLGELLNREPFTVYCGFDPSADSLHVGNLLGLITLARFQRAGHRPIAVAGGGTGFIGDPSGKSEERGLLTAEQLEHNLLRIRGIIERILDFKATPAPQVLNNADWLRGISYIDFLRDVGKHFTINHMMEKESVRARLEDRSHGISYTEFSYMLLQAYDFLHLYQEQGCRLQVGGSDQFGNITAGCELIRRVQASRRKGEEATPQGHYAYGLTWPLLTRSDGKKFGKTEEGAVWLTADRTSPYAFYQYFINVPDSDAPQLLRSFTERSREEIAALEQELQTEPQKRSAQRTLARELTERIHGPTEREQAERAAQALFGGGELAGIDEATLLEIFKETPGGELPKSRLEGEGVPLLDLLAESGLYKSRGDAKRAFQAGSVNLNNLRITELGRLVRTADLLHGRYLVLRKGKKEYFVYRVSA